MFVWRAPHRGIDRLAFSPDGRRLAAGGNGPGIAVWHVGGGGVAEVWAPAARPVRSLHFTPDGRSVIAEGGFFREDYGVVQFDTASGRPTPGGFQQTRAGWLLASAAGDRVVCCEWRTLYRMVELGPVGAGPEWAVSRGLAQLPQAARPLALLSSGRVVVTQYALTPDESAAAHQPDSLLIQVPEVGPCRLAPFRSDRVAVLGPGGLAIWRPGDRTITRPVRPPDGHRLTALAVHPDDQSVVTGGADGVVRVWNAEVLAERAAFDWRCGGLRAVAVAPDGLTAAVATSQGKVVLFDLD